MKVTFTEEAVARMDPTRLGELIQHRVRIGARAFEVVTLDEAVGRLSAMGIPVVGDVTTIATPLEVEPTFPAPTPDEVDELLARISVASYASEAVEAVESWLEERYGVVGRVTAALREADAKDNVEPLSPRAQGIALDALLSGTARLDSSMVSTDA